MQLTLDLSPILVNRTAVYDICIEVDRIARARRSVQLDYQFVGQRFPFIPSPEKQRELRDLSHSRQSELARTTGPRPDPVMGEIARRRAAGHSTSIQSIHCSAHSVRMTS